MNPGFLVFGQLTREYLLPPAGLPRLDGAGGSLLYAAGGLGVWEKSIGLVGRVGNDYPREWLNQCIARGLDTRGIRILPQNLDVREFTSNDSLYERNSLRSRFWGRMRMPRVSRPRAMH